MEMRVMRLVRQTFNMQRTERFVYFATWATESKCNELGADLAGDPREHAIRFKFAQGSVPEHYCVGG